MDFFAQKWHFWPNIGIFCQFDPMSDQETIRTSYLGGFSVWWVPKRMLSPLRIWICCPKTTKFGPKLAFWSFWARPCRLIRCPVVGLVGCCGARAVSCKTPIYFIVERNYLGNCILGTATSSRVHLFCKSTQIYETPQKTFRSD